MAADADEFDEYSGEVALPVAGEGLQVEVAEVVDAVVFEACSSAVVFPALWESLESAGVVWAVDGLARFEVYAVEELGGGGVLAAAAFAAGTVDAWAAGVVDYGFDAVGVSLGLRASVQFLRGHLMFTTLCSMMSPGRHVRRQASHSKYWYLPFPMARTFSSPHLGQVATLTGFAS